ncbi:MAG: pectate lyase [Dysgonomonas sp.]
MKNIKIILSSIFLFLSANSYAQAQSKLIGFDKDGRLVYHPYTEQGDIIPDFSYCGYMGGGIAIPDVEVVAVIGSPSGLENDAPMIQHVIDSVSQLRTNHYGFRGAILVKKGTYKIGVPLKLEASGIILRGEGNTVNGTVLLATSPKKYSVIEIGKNIRPVRIASTEKNISDNYVPSGTRIIHVDKAEEFFKTGEYVIVQRPSTAEWIHGIGMDSILPRPRKGETPQDVLQRFRETKGKTDMNGTQQWEPGSKDVRYERRIIGVKGNEITLDVPITNALQKEYGGAKVYKYTFEQRIKQCGIENIYGMSVFDETVTEKNKFGNEDVYFSDEKHANIFANFLAVENAWIRNVNVEHFDYCVSTALYAKYITCQDLSAINPISQITGGRRYAYSISGQMNLFQRCYAKEHRHAFILQSSVAGPNAFVDSRGEESYASSEPHQRWSTGCLFDNIEIDGPEACLSASNRGNMGSGHGWSGAQMVFWNCKAPFIFVMQPPTAQNFAIGCVGTNDKWSEDIRNKIIRYANNATGSDLEYTDKNVGGTGWIESIDKNVLPQSLYYQQLKDRLGNQALQSVMTEIQMDKFFNKK